MANLAIVIAVSEYNHDATSLPACKNDGNLIEIILKHSGRFDEILYIDTTEDSQSIKIKIANFVKKHHNTEVDEVFFYFSGHGEAQQEDAFFLLGDFQTAKTKQTSLSNVEIDDQIRSLNPKLFTKVIDSCHSGVSYLKSAEEFTEVLNKGRGRFKQLYFMFSSQQDQGSFADNNISYFTASFARTILDANNGPLRHRDIINGIADEFSSNNKQTPLFVIQADHTDIFIDVDADIKRKISEILSKGKAITDTKMIESNASISDRIKKDATRYCTKKEALETIVKIKDLVKKRKYLSDDLADLFTTQIDPISEDVPGGKTIGRWLEKNDREKQYFARPKSEQQSYQRRAPKNSWLAGLKLLNNEPEDFVLISDVRTIIVGFNQTNEMDYEYIKIYLAPSYPNINPHECLIVPIFTKIDLRLFWSFSRLHPIDWDKWQRDGEMTWKTEACEIKDVTAVEALIGKIAMDFRGFVEEPLRATWDTPPLNGQVSEESERLGAIS